MSSKVIIWDLGNVLVDWSPRYLYDKIFPDEQQRNHFLEHVCSMKWHSEVDAGKHPSVATEELTRKHPEWAGPIKAFYARWKEMFQGPIAPSVEILAELKQKGFPQYALTNWSAELFEQSRSDFPFLEWFDGLVISGAEGLTKPEPAIYLILLQRYGIDAANAVFIDDRPSNVQTALSLGMDGIVFHDPESLRRDLALRGLL